MNIIGIYKSVKLHKPKDTRTRMHLTWDMRYDFHCAGDFNRATRHINEKADYHVKHQHKWLESEWAYKNRVRRNKRIHKIS